MMKVKVFLAFLLASNALLLIINSPFVPFSWANPDVAAYYPSGYNLFGSTKYVSGALADLQSNNGVYMTFHSYTNYDFRYGESLGQSDTTSTAYQDKVTLTFTPPTSGDYIIIADAEVKGSSTSYRSLARLYIGTTVYQELMYRVKDTLDWYPFNALKRLSLSASTTIKIQFCSSSTSATASIRNARLIAFKLSSEYAESEGRTTTTNTGWQTKATLTFTPTTAGDYLVIATANLDGSSTSYDVKCQLLQDDATVQASVVRRATSSTARYNFGAMRKITLSAASHNFKIQYCSSNTLGTAGISYAHIIAIRVDQFPHSYYQETEAESSPAASGTWYDKVTSTYTPEAADHLIIGTIHHTSASSSYSVGIRLNQDGTIATDRLIEQQASTDYESSFSFTKASLTATSKTDKIQYMGESTATKVKMARIISLQLFDQIMEVEFTGSSNTESWTQLVWTVDSAWTNGSVSVTLQLYNYATASYPISGDGYISYTSNATANTDETKTQTITTNPTNFRQNGTGNWQIKIKGIKSTTTQFDFKGDLVKFEVTYQVIDTVPPQWSNAGTNSTFAGQPTLFHVKWTDNVGLSGFVFGTNNTGTWLNGTWTPMNGAVNWSNVTKILNSTVGVIVLWRVWANDTSNNWNNTGILSLTTTTVGYALNLRVKDWDLIDSISNAYVYKNSDIKMSDANGWANWTGVSGTVQIKVKWYGSWVNGTFSVTVNADKCIDVRCNIFDIVITTIEGVQGAILQYANVTMYNSEGSKIRTGITGSDGKVSLANVPNSTLTFTVYDGASPQHMIANVTRTITTENQAETVTCDQNYVSTTQNWSIMGSLNTTLCLGLVLIPGFGSRYVKCLKERIKTVRSKQKIGRKEVEKYNESLCQ